MEQYQLPDYSMTFDDDKGHTVTSEEPTDLNALTKKVLSSLNPAPVIDDLPESYVKLPAGILVDGSIRRDAEVQELTGEHEEKLAKARQSGNPAKFVATLLQCGTVEVGGKPATPELLDSMIQGDLDTLILAIRKATFGDTFELFEVPCPSCGEESDIELNLNDIPVTEMDSDDRDFLVDLRKGRKARIQFPTGAVQTEIFKKPVSVPEMNSITLDHCVLAFIEADGRERPSNGLLDVKKLGLADRQVLQDFIVDKQPGPRYDKVTAKCPSCDGEVLVPINIGILFRGI